MLKLKAIEPESVTLAGENVPVRIRRSAAAKRMILRICDVSGDVKVTLPKRTSIRAASRFIAEHTGWLEKTRAAMPVAEQVTDGYTIHYRGQPCALVFSGQAPRKVAVGDGTIVVGGPVDLAPKRLLNWLKTEARQQLDLCASHHAATLGVSYARIGIGDMRSRWGSCSSARTLKFNWRLIMAPDDVLDYVAAHEVAHLLEMNHSPRFWAHVMKCCPEFDRQRKWLRTGPGQALMKVRFD
ncbi:M48 family metallopeptidase [Kordiimonas aestuarii]|uniref:M48 family metallopeptidase n=1 Tax=Kordiimonas aestuarii TaxID=1005925 RepID=UPI0021D035EB|nr:SprT family zinc-dependent metalloprotease [Kordiimonas aestuarii]